MPKRTKKTAARTKNGTQAVRMTTGQAVVNALLSHGIDTVYALPGVHNDHFFDALYKAGNRVRVVHTRHEQGCAYMALGAALATGNPQVYSVVPGPGFLNTGAALLTAYSMNAPVLGLIGQIPQSTIRRDLGQLHEIRDQAGIIARLVDHSARIPRAADAPRMVAEAVRSMFIDRPGPAALECGMDVWGRAEPVVDFAPLDPIELPVDDDAITAAAKLLGAAKNPMIVCGGGAQDASKEVTRLSAMLQAPVLGYRRGRGILDSRDPLSITLPLAHEMWPEVDVVIGVGSRLLQQLTVWGTDKDLKVIRVEADPDEPERAGKPDVTLLGDSAHVLRKLLAALPAHNTRRKSRKAEMEERQAKLRKRLSRLVPQMAILEAIRAELPEDGIFVDEVTQIGFAARLSMPVYKPRTFISPGYQDNLGWGFATALGVQDARRDVPVLSISGDGGFLYTASELASAVRHKIPLVTVVFNNNSYGNVKLIQQEWYGGRTIASDLTNPDFVKFAESFGAAAERVESPAELRAALRRGFKRRGGPTLIDMPVGPMPSPWDFIMMPRVRG
ncbi:thiamine pyrophosphate-dependent enzyme [Pseudorhodoplanes sp.]|uniref:thiamine pyrophosphate-dependent enzyme n=1 Tax=Pseudorhodoplanes sp. TaxID=1934341 RepID=UPI002D80DAF9|nr:thiamine pyrophosphate-dependent enzyme [Pseudorhodoplanes sp.]